MVVDAESKGGKSQLGTRRDDVKATVEYLRQCEDEQKWRRLVLGWAPAKGSHTNYEAVKTGESSKDVWKLKQKTRKTIKGLCLLSLSLFLPSLFPHDVLFLSV